LSLTAALRAGRRRRSGRRPGAVAGFAVLLARNLDRGLGTARRFLERDLEVVAQVGAALRSAAPAPTAEQIAEAQHVAEDVGEVAELLEHRRVEARAGAGRRLHAGVSEAIVEAALLGIGEDRVGFRGLLEFLFGRRVAGIAIRVIPHRQLAIGALD